MRLAAGKPGEGSKVLPRNQYTAIRDEKPKSKEEAKRPEFKVRKFTKDAIITEGSEVGTVHKVCANPACPVHHPKPQTNRHDDAMQKAEQEKERKEQAIANTTAIRVMKTIRDAVPLRLMKRDLLFVLMQIFPLLGEWQLQTLARQHGIRKDRETDMLDKLFAAFLRRADEGTLSRLLVEVSVVLASGRSNGGNALREAAAVYKVDTDAIATTARQDDVPPSCTFPLDRLRRLRDEKGVDQEWEENNRAVVDSHRFDNNAVFGVGISRPSPIAWMDTLCFYPANLL
jgi:ParB family transcriptional regulator, chromosome partitioning protein